MTWGSSKGVEATPAVIMLKGRMLLRPFPTIPMFTEGSTTGPWLVTLPTLELTPAALLLVAATSPLDVKLVPMLLTILTLLRVLLICTVLPAVGLVTVGLVVGDT